MDPHTFSLPDADGRPHAYELIPHPATQGQAILWQLVALGAEPLGRVVASGLAGGGATPVAGLLAMDAASLMARVDFAAVAGDVKRSVQSMPMGALARDILSRTTRDGKPLDNQLHFDAAFTRNYVEFMRALWEAIRINRFLPLSGS